MTRDRRDSRALLHWLLPLAISGRLWLVVVVAAGYTAGVCHLGRTVLTAAPVWVDEFAVINALVIGVLVGFRTKTSYDRWWEGRSLWGALTNNVRNLCLKAVALADPPAADRRELFRLAAGFPVALLRHLRGPVTLAEVPGFENDEAAPAHVPAALAGRVFGLIASWRRAGHIDGHAQQLLDAHAAALMDVCGACEKVRHTPLPGSYLTLLRHGLILGLLVIPWHLAYAVGFWAVPAQVLIVYFLVGVELVAEEVEQPFGFDGDDLPLERYAATMRANAAEILGCE